MTHLPRLASLVFGRPHFITPQAGRAIADVINSRNGYEPQASRFIGDEQVQTDQNGNVITDRYGNPKRKGFRMQGATAIVDVLGELVNRGAWLNASSGLISYEGLTQVLRTVAADPRVKNILLDMNSPGGEASGMTDVAALVRQIAAEKPVFAVANSMMASAAYGIASGATRIYTTDLGLVGSIGVVTMHADYSRALDNQGVTITLFHAGAHKVDGHPFAPLPDDVRSDIQAEIDQYYAAFVDTVAAGRRNLNAKLIRATEARTYLGRESVKVGLADQVGTFEEALAELEKAATGQSSYTVPQSYPITAAPPSKTVKGNAVAEPEPPQPTGKPMSDKTHTQADIDAAVTAATTKATANAASAERGRIKAIMGHASAAGQPALAAHFAYDTDMSADAACTALAAAAPAKAAATPAAAPVATAPAKPAATLAGLELAEPATAQAKPAAVKGADVFKARRAAKAD